MTAPAPAVSPAEALAFIHANFGLRGELKPLASERDQNFRLTTDTGERYVLKISNPAESPDVLDFQAQALLHVAHYAPDLPAPRIVPTRDGQPLARIRTPAGTCMVRLVSWLDGKPVGDVPWTPELRRNLGRMLARLGVALRGYFHGSAQHPLLWDMRQAAAVARLAAHVGDPAQRALVESVFATHFRRTHARLGALRAQVIHNDCNPDNVLVSATDSEQVSAIIDFGDMVHAPLINDLAVLVAYQVVGSAQPVEAACELVGAYHAESTLAPAEVDTLADLVALRLGMSVCIGTWRGRQHPDNADYILGQHEQYWQALGTWTAFSNDELTAAFRTACGITKSTETTARGGIEAVSRLRERRATLLGPSLRLSYEEPLHIVRGAGAWLYDADGRAYLDAYNNVACVGHSHPAVVAAIAGQARVLNTNTRYLHEHIVTYAARLSDLLPGELSVCYFVCTGSEANDLAWQIARAVTGNDGAIVTSFAYHGNTTAVQQLSPEELGPGQQEDWVVTTPAPDCYRGQYGRGRASAAPDAGASYAALLDDAIGELERRGRRPAAFFVDTIYTSDGIHIAPSGYLDGAWRRVRAAGGLCIADEVQAGLGRTGEYFWGFEQQGVVPDIVTLGKPMGNGHPLAAVVTTPAIARAFAAGRYYFNTFGGNPVSCAAGLAVLEVLERERLQENARATGRYLGQELEALAARHELIGDVRGSGLFRGVELVRDRNTREPASDAAHAVVNGLRRNGVLVGRTGLASNVLKIRPPLVFSRDNVTTLVAALDTALTRARELQ